MIESDVCNCVKVDLRSFESFLSPSSSDVSERALVSFSDLYELKLAAGTVLFLKLKQIHQGFV